MVHKFVFVVWQVVFIQTVLAYPMDYAVSEGVGEISAVADSILSPGVTDIEGAGPAGGGADFNGPVRGSGSVTIVARSTRPLLSHPETAPAILPGVMPVVQPVCSPCHHKATKPLTKPVALRKPAHIPCKPPMFQNTGVGKLTAVGDLTVSGRTTVEGVLPTSGKTVFHGFVPAKGTVVIRGSCRY